MKRKVFLILFLCCWIASANVSIIKNGSFEYDGYIADLTAKAPHYWCNVDIPENFFAWVDDDWLTADDYCLTFHSSFTNFSVGDMATVSQVVYLNGVSKIYFDLSLSDIYDDFSWTDDDRSAVVLIDGSEVWNSLTDLPNSVDGVYPVEINDIDVNDTRLHLLTLGLKSNISGFAYNNYYAQWDSIRFDTYCEGSGYADLDFNLDCVIDTADFAVIAENWLLEEPNELADVYTDGLVDMYDFAVIADKWMQFGSGDSDSLMAGDLNDDGIINLIDFALLGNEWRLTGGCLKADTDNSKRIDNHDLAEISNTWLEKNWLYEM